jgi:flagellin
MAISVHTNTAALVALQNLNSTNEKLTEAQSRISTGLKIANAKDNAAVWSIAQDQRASIGALAAVKMSLDRATSVSQVTMSAGESVSDLLVQIKEKVVAAMDPSISASSRQALNSDYKSLLRQISQVVSSAEFNGSNILDGSLAADIKFLANESATNFITLSVKNMTLGGSIITVGSASSIGTVTIATTVLARIDASLANVNSALGDIGAQAKQIENHNTFVSKLTDVLETGVGNLVDADVAKESAALQALQVQQQLGAQALSIANSAPQIILSLFRGG